MGQLIPSLAVLVEGFRGCFRQEVFVTFPARPGRWIIGPGPRTISEVWQATGRAGQDHWARAYGLFASASWDWDDLSKIRILVIVARLIPTGAVWLVVDDTLCHTRGARVALGGFFLDTVTSTKKKNFRFGVNGVVLGLAVHLPFRPDRCFCRPVVWRVYRKKGTPGHQTRTELAAGLARQVAQWLPGRECGLVRRPERTRSPPLSRDDLEGLTLGLLAALGVLLGPVRVTPRETPSQEISGDGMGRAGTPGGPRAAV